MQALKGRAARGVWGYSPPEKFEILVLRDAISSFLRAKFLSKKLTKSIVIFMQNFYLHGFLYEYSILFIFVWCLKFFGVSVFVTYTLISVLV